MDTDSTADVQATVSWLFVATIVLTALISFAWEPLLWCGFLLVLAAVTALPALVFRDWTAMVPWPLPAAAAVAALIRAFSFYREFAGYLAIVVLALIVVIELDLFTSVELSQRFAVVFGVMVTMALEAVWIVAQHYSDLYFETELLRSQAELQWDIVVVTFTATAVGLLYQWYAVRFDPASSVTVSTGEKPQ